MVYQNQADEIFSPEKLGLKYDRSSSPEIAKDDKKKKKVDSFGRLSDEVILNIMLDKLDAHFSPSSSKDGET
jgi:hypothetical protein